MRAADPNSRFIVISFVDATLVLAVGDTVEETRDSGMEGRYPTLAVSLLDGDVILQVHSAGVRQVSGKIGCVVRKWGIHIHTAAFHVPLCSHMYTHTHTHTHTHKYTHPQSSRLLVCPRQHPYLPRSACDVVFCIFI